MHKLKTPMANPKNHHLKNMVHYLPDTDILILVDSWDLVEVPASMRMQGHLDPLVGFEQGGLLRMGHN